MMRKVIILLAVLTLAAPLMFYGCSGDDGSNGAPGDMGPPGLTGPPGPPGTGVVADETCAVCHAAGGLEPVQAAHKIAADGTQMAPMVSLTIDNVSRVINADNVVVTVGFTFAAFDVAGTNVTDMQAGSPPATIGSPTSGSPWPG
jgi:hypothetical protein